MVKGEEYGLIRQWKNLLYGDDTWARVIDEKFPYKDRKTGIELKPYLIQPTPQLVKMFPELTKPEAYHHKGWALWVEYPTFLVNDNNPSRQGAIARVACSFDGKETFEALRIKQYTDQIKRLEIENDSLIFEILTLREENKELRASNLEKMRYYKEMFDMMEGKSDGEVGEEEED